MFKYNVEIMKMCLFILFIFSVVSAEHEEEITPSPETPLPEVPLPEMSRVKRDAVGALHIVNNHEMPIHADVKAEGETTEKPCPEGSKPSHIDAGVGFKVTPPEDTMYAMKSLRKSLPLQPSSTYALDLLRTTSRVVTVIVLVVTAMCEFYPTLYKVTMAVYNFVNNQ